MGVFEGVGAIADHPLRIALRIAGIADVEGGDPQVAALGLVDQGGDAGVAAGPMAFADGRLQPLDAGAGLGVLGLGGGVVVEVAEVGGDDDRRLRPAPQPRQDVRHLTGRRVADQDRQHLDVAQRPLDERQVDLEAVLADERFRRDGGVRLAGEGVAGFSVDGQGAQRRRPGVGGVEGDPVHRHPVGWTDQDHALDLTLALGEQAVGGAGDVAGIDMAGVRRDHRLGVEAGRCGLGEAGVNARGQFAGIGRIEEAGDAGGEGLGHGALWIVTGKVSIAPELAKRTSGRGGFDVRRWTANHQRPERA